MAAQIKVGDLVGFKCDIEQYSKVHAIRNHWSGEKEYQVTVTDGQYYPRGTKIWMRQRDVWTDDDPQTTEIL